jgi:hypothetical protein
MYSFMGKYTSSYGQFYHSSNREVDYMDVLKPEFELADPNDADDVDNAGGDGNARLNDVLRSAESAMDDGGDDAVTAVVVAAVTGSASSSSSNGAPMVGGGCGDDDTVCQECEVSSAAVFCEQCEDRFCGVCYASQHRKGGRLHHTTTPLTSAGEDSPMQGDAAAAAAAAATTTVSSQPEWFGATRIDGAWFEERARYQPVRLSHEERKFLRLVEAVLDSSDYTAKVDRAEFSVDNPQLSERQKMKARSRRTFAQVKGISAVFTGLIAATSLEVGRRTVDSSNIAANAVFLQHILELGRRHKIRSPEKMRSAYGQLLSR